MNCKGCEHCKKCRIVEYPVVYPTFHYCDTIWGIDADGGTVSITESWKRCKGISYKLKQ